MTYNHYWNKIDEYMIKQQGKKVSILNADEVRDFLKYSQDEWEHLEKDGVQAPFGFNNPINEKLMFSVDSVCKWLVSNENHELDEMINYDINELLKDVTFDKSELDEMINYNIDLEI